MVNCEWLRELPQRFECFAIVSWKIGDINCAKVREPVAILSLPFLCTVPYIGDNLVIVFISVKYEILD